MLKDSIKGLRELQALAPWTDLWGRDYRLDPRDYKDFEHCLINIVACTGRMLQEIERSDHYGRDSDQVKWNKDSFKKELAYILMSALKAGNCIDVDVAEHVEKDYIRRGVPLLQEKD